MTDTSFLSTITGLGVPTAKTVPITDVNSQEDLLNLKRKQALAGLLLQQSQQPDNTPQQIDGHYIHRSPFLALAKAAQMMLGVKMGSEAEAQGVQLQKDALGRLLGAAGAGGAPLNPAGSLGTQVQANEQSGLPWQTGQAIPVADAAPQMGGMGGDAPLAVRNMTPAQRAALLQIAPDEYMKTFAAQFAPTDQQKNDAYMGINPNQARTLHLAEQAKNLGVEGALPSLDAQGNISIAAIPGAAATKAGIAGAVQHAQESNKILPNMTVNGMEGVPVWGSDIPPLSGQSQGKATPQEIDAIARANGGVTANQPIQFGQNIGDKTAKEKVAAEAGNLQKELSDRSEASVGVRQSLSEMRNLLQNFDPNRAENLKMKLGSLAQAAGVDQSRINRLLNTSVSDVQAFQKQTAALAIETVKQISPRATQMEFQQFLQNNPNVEMTPGGIKKVIDYMDNTAQQNIDKYQSFADFKSSNPPSKWSDFNAYYNKDLSKKISEGAFNSPPSSQSQTKTKSDLTKSTSPLSPAEMQELDALRKRFGVKK